MKRSRREVMGFAAAVMTMRATEAMAQNPTPEEIQKRLQEYRAKALANFPFKLIDVPGRDAMRKWQELKSAGGGKPVILGGTEHLDNILEPFGPSELPPGYARPTRSVADMLAAADRIKFPDDLIARRESEEARNRAAVEKMRDDPNARAPTIIQIDGKGRSRTLSREEAIASMLGGGKEPLGEWPAKANESPGLTVATDTLSGKFLDKVYLTVIPTDDWTAIPAHLRWGGWNANPEPEWHIAALRSWRDRYGTELIGLSFDVMNLKVARQPPSRDEAIALAREQYAYCADIVDQGVGTISQLARDLMDEDWWFFWWD
jgi:hypothetical protein